MDERLRASLEEQHDIVVEIDSFLRACAEIANVVKARLNRIRTGETLYWQEEDREIIHAEAEIEELLRYTYALHIGATEQVATIRGRLGLRATDAVGVHATRAERRAEWHAQRRGGHRRRRRTAEE